MKFKYLICPPEYEFAIDLMLFRLKSEKEFIKKNKWGLTDERLMQELSSDFRHSIFDKFTTSLFIAGYSEKSKFLKVPTVEHLFSRTLSGKYLFAHSDMSRNDLWNSIYYKLARIIKIIPEEHKLVGNGFKKEIDKFRNDKFNDIDEKYMKKYIKECKKRGMSKITFINEYEKLNKYW